MKYRGENRECPVCKTGLSLIPEDVGVCSVCKKYTVELFCERCKNPVHFWICENCGYHEK